MFYVTSRRITTKETRDSGVKFLRRAERVISKAPVEEVDLGRKRDSSDEIGKIKVRDDEDRCT